MIYMPESFYETTITAAITASQNTIPVTTAPNITAGYMVIEANTSNREIIKYTGVSGTTLTGVVRGLASYGSDDSAGTGKAHAAGVDLANKDVHFYYAQYYDYLVGTSATGANTMRIGDGNTISASDRLWYVHTSSLSAWWGLSANGKFVISEDGSTSYVVSAGGSGVSEGDGIDITAGVVTFNYLSAGGFRLSGDKVALNVSQGVSTTSAGELYVDPTHDFTWTGSHTFKGAVSLSSVNAASASFTNLPTGAGLTPTSGSHLTTKSYVDAGDGVATASDTLQASADIERQSVGSYSYTKVKEITMKYSGSVRVKWQGKSSNANDAYGRVYKNGVAVGVETKFNGTVYADVNEDFSVNKGDQMQLYLEGQGVASTAYGRNFRIYYDVTALSADIVVTD